MASRWWNRLRKGIPWLAPPATVVVVLAAGHGMGVQEQALDFQMPAAPPAPAAAAEPRVLALPLQLPEGAPAAGALAMLLSPEPAVAVAGADGIARLSVRSPGPYRVWAYLDGHALLQPEPFDTPPQRPLRFERVPDAPTALEPPLEVAERRLRVVEAGSGAPLAGALVLGGEHREGTHPFALAFADADGWVSLGGTPPGPLSVHVYAPLLPPDDAWRLVSRALGSDDAQDQPMTIEVAPARVTLNALPPGEVLRVERLDVPGLLPLILVPPTAGWSSNALPPGRYRFQVLERSLEAELAPGPNVLDYSGANTRSGSSGIPGE